MAMLLTCSNRSCGYSDYHRLDESTNEILCTKCGQPGNYSSYAKTALKQMKQVVKKIQSDFGATCETCGAVDEPVLRKYSSMKMKVVCNQCDAVNAHLTRYFVEAIKLRPDVKIKTATPEQMLEAGVKSTKNLFGEARTANFEVSSQKTILATSPEDPVPEVRVLAPLNMAVEADQTSPVKVEYYSGVDQKPTEVVAITGSIVISPTSEEPILVDKKVANMPARVQKPVKVLPNEDKLRQRIENMPVDLAPASEAPPPPGLNLADFATSGVIDYVGDMED